MKKRNLEGFSIVELVITIVVGATFIAGLSVVINNYTSLGKRGRNLTLMNSYAEGKVEALRSIGYNGLNNGTTSVSSELPSQLSGPKNASLTISQPQNGLKQIDLSITYNDNGTNRTYDYKTYVGELGVGQ